MAEIKLFEVDLTQTIVSIERLRNELKVTKKEFESAEVGSAQFEKLGSTVKTLQAEIKRLSDTTKANTQALGGINASAKFAEGSYGQLKQQIKGTKDELLKYKIGSQEFIKVEKELVALENRRIEVEKNLPSLFKERIKGAVDEANSLKQLRAELKAAQSAAVGGDKEAIARVAELKDKLDDLTDATKTLKGSGIEQLTASTQLLQEGLANFDLGKLEIAFEGLGNAMKAIPIFLLIEGIKLLIENIDKVVGFLNSFTESAQDVKKLEKALAETTRETEKQKVALQGLVDVGNAQIELLRAQGAGYDKIIAKEKEVFQSKLQLIRVDAEQVKASALTNIAKLKEINTNDDITESIKRVSAEYQRKLGNDVIADAIEKQIADDKKKRSKEVTDALAADQNKLTELQNSLQVLLIENKTKEIETGKELKQKRIELEDFLKQLSINSIKDERDRQVNQLIFDEEVAKREAKIKLKGKKELQFALDNIEKDFRNQQLELQKQFAQEDFQKEQEKIQKQLDDAKALKLQEIANEKAGLELIINSQESNLTEIYEAKKKLLQEQREEELAAENLSYNERLAIKQKFDNEELRLEEEKKRRRIEIRNEEIEFNKQAALILLNITQLFAQSQDQQAALAKLTALVNIAANTAQAISGLTAISFSPVNGDNAVNPIGPYLKLATGIATITANAVQAKQLLNSFEEGGYTGDGATNEVSTNLGTKPYTYHKGEYVIPARVLNTQTGAMLASQAETMRLGMSNPMPYISGMYDGGFTARSAGQEAMTQVQTSSFIKNMIASMPTPVVKVTDINKVQSNNSKAISVSSL